MSNARTSRRWSACSSATSGPTTGGTGGGRWTGLSNGIHVEVEWDDAAIARRTKRAFMRCEDIRPIIDHNKPVRVPARTRTRNAPEPARPTERALFTWYYIPYTKLVRDSVYMTTQQHQGQSMFSYNYLVMMTVTLDFANCMCVQMYNRWHRSYSPPCSATSGVY